MMTDVQKDEFATLFRRGTRLLHQQKVSEAIPLLEKAVALEPNHADAIINLSGAYILTKKFKKGVAILEPLSKAQPDNPKIWTNLGAAYLGNPVLARAEEQLKAVEAFTRALEIDPIAHSVAYNIGLIYRDRKEIDKAIHWFEKAVQANPMDRDARTLLRRLQSQSADE